MQPYSDWISGEIVKSYAIQHITVELKITLQSRNLRCPFPHIFFGEQKKTYATYHPQRNWIELNSCLITEYRWPELWGVVLHEAAHMVAHWIIKADAVHHHGETFLEACRLLGVPRHFWSAAVDLGPAAVTDNWKLAITNLLELPSKSENGQKIEKLLALAQSPNVHEAALALQKAREWMLKERLELRNQGDTRPVHAYYILTNRIRGSRTLDAIIRLLKEFFYVEVVYDNYPCLKTQKLKLMLTFIGFPHHLKMANHIYEFLLHQIEYLWKQSKLKGINKKLSFELGIVRGLDKQLREMQHITQTDISPTHGKELALYEKQDKAFLEAEKNRIYANLTNKSVSAPKLSADAFRAGLKEGESLKIHQPISSSNNSTLSLDHK